MRYAVMRCRMSAAGAAVSTSWPAVRRQLASDSPIACEPYLELDELDGRGVMASSWVMTCQTSLGPGPAGWLGGPELGWPAWTLDWLGLGGRPDRLGGPGLGLGGRWAGAGWVHSSVAGPHVLGP
jgi:hypothetical protein